jgi:hypothetical protein
LATEMVLAAIPLKQNAQQNLSCQAF